MKELLYPVGTKVRIRPDTRYYRKGDSHNPIDIAGIVIQNDSSDSNNYRVNWSADINNSYAHSDLEPADAVVNTYETF